MGIKTVTVTVTVVKITLGGTRKRKMESQHLGGEPDPQEGQEGMAGEVKKR